MKSLGIIAAALLLTSCMTIRVENVEAGGTVTINMDKTVSVEDAVDASTLPI